MAGVVDKLWGETVGGRNHKIISVISVSSVAKI